jgi:exosortase
LRLARPFSDSFSALAALALVGLVVYAPVLAKLAADWWTNPEYSHGLLCVPAALAIAFSRRRHLAALPVAPTALGLAGAVLAVALLGLGTLGAELFLTRLSLALFLASSILYLFGRHHLRALAFPFALLLLSIPIPALLITRLTLPLQLTASAMSESGLMAAGVPVLREGNVLVLPNATLQVAEACSGIRSLVALVVLALVIGRSVDRRPGARAAILLAAVPVAVLVNGMRVTITALAAYRFGPSVTSGAVHETLGVLTFAAAVVLLGACAQLVRSIEPRMVAGVAP